MNQENERGREREREREREKVREGERDSERERKRGRETGEKKGEREKERRKEKVMGREIETTEDFKEILWTFLCLFCVRHLTGSTEPLGVPILSSHAR